MLAADRTWAELSTAIDGEALFILPLGAIEQHGPHLPVDTDCACVQYLAEEVAARAGALSLPVLPYGAPSRPRSGGGAVYPPGAEIPLDAYHGLLRGLAARLLGAGIRRLLVLSWHFENAAVLGDALGDAVDDVEPGAKVVSVDSPLGLLGPGELEELLGRPVNVQLEHAGLLETAMMLAIDRGRVGEFEDTASSPPAVGYDVFPYDGRPRIGTGSFTAPQGATAELGSMLLGRMTDRLAEVIEAEFGESG